MEVIFPDIHIEEFIKSEYYSVRVYTNVRVRSDDGVWYKTPVYRSTNSPDFKDSVVNELINDAYKASLLMIVNLSVIDQFGDELFVLDDDQRTEAERLNARN